MSLILDKKIAKRAYYITYFITFEAAGLNIYDEISIIGRMQNTS